MHREAKTTKIIEFFTLLFPNYENTNNLESGLELNLQYVFRTLFPATVVPERPRWKTPLSYQGYSNFYRSKRLYYQCYYHHKVQQDHHYL